MNHYEKLTIVLLRGVACSFLLFALSNIASALLSSVFSHENYGAYPGIYYLLSYGGYIIGSTTLFALSKPLATLVAGKL